jgi:hypothetical protein
MCTVCSAASVVHAAATCSSVSYSLVALYTDCSREICYYEFAVGYWAIGCIPHIFLVQQEDVFFLLTIWLLQLFS